MATQHALRTRKPEPIGHVRKRALLKAFAKLGTVTAASQAANIARSTHYEWMDTDPTYAAAFEHARAEAADSLEAEAIARARDGWREPVYQGGKMVGTILKKSDTLLIFLLKGLRPEKFRDRQELSGSIAAPVTYQIITGFPE